MRTIAPAGAVPPAALMVGVGTVAASGAGAAIAGIGRPALLAAAGTATLVVSVVLGVRTAWFVPAIVIIGFSVQPAVKFFVSDAIGPAKDAFVAVAVGITAVGLVAASRHWRSARATTSGSRLGWAMPVVVAMLIALYLVDAGGQHGPGWADATRLTVEAFALLLVGYFSFQRGCWQAAESCLIALAVFETTVGIMQQLIGVNQLVTHFGYLYGEQVRQASGGFLRSFGTLDDPFNYASLVLLSFVVVVQRRSWNRRWLAVAIYLAIGVILSIDRTDIALLAVAGGLALWRQKHGAAALAVVLAAAGVAVVYFSASAPGQSAGGGSLLSLNGRIGTWGQVVTSPSTFVLGLGVGEAGTGLARSQTSGVVTVGHSQPGVDPTAGASTDLTSIDSSYLALVADVGIGGLLVFALLVLLLVVQCVRMCRAGSHAAWCALAAMALLLLDGLTRSSLTSFPFGFVALYVIGVAIAAARSDVDARAEVRYRRGWTRPAIAA